MKYFFYLGVLTAMGQIVISENPNLFQQEFTLHWGLFVALSIVWLLAMYLLMRYIKKMLSKVFISVPAYLWAPLVLAFGTLLLVIVGWLLPFYSISFFQAIAASLHFIVVTLFTRALLQQEREHMQRETYREMNPIGNSFDQS